MFTEECGIGRQRPWEPLIPASLFHGRTKATPVIKNLQTKCTDNNFLVTDRAGMCVSNQLRMGLRW